MWEENEMEFSGVYHKTSEQMSYALDEDRLIVNIKTGYDVKQVFIHYGDPYEAGILGGKEKWIGKREEMIYKKRLPYQIWWTTTLLPEYKRCKGTAEAVLPHQQTTLLSGSAGFLSP